MKIKALDRKVFESIRKELNSGSLIDKIALKASLAALKASRKAIMATMTKEELAEYRRIKGGY